MTMNSDVEPKKNTGAEEEMDKAVETPEVSEAPDQNVSEDLDNKDIQNKDIDLNEVIKKKEYMSMRSPM